jgi:hypothetical protein
MIRLPERHVLHNLLSFSALYMGIYYSYEHRSVFCIHGILLRFTFSPLIFAITPTEIILSHTDYRTKSYISRRGNAAQTPCCWTQSLRYVRAKIAHGAKQSHIATADCTLRQKIVHSSKMGNFVRNTAQPTGLAGSYYEGVGHYDR